MSYSDGSYDIGLAIPESLTGETLNVSVLPETVRYSLRAKPGDMAAIRKMLSAKTHDLTLPDKIGQMGVTGRAVTAKLGPDEWMLWAEPKQADKLAKTFAALSKKFTVSATDISHRNSGLILTGEASRRAINIGCPLDLSLDAFPMGKATRTVFENAPIILMRVTEDDLRIDCWRSYGSYIVGFFERFVREL